MTNLIKDKQVDRETPKFVIYHEPTGSVHTSIKKTDFVESFGYTGESNFIKFDEETSYKMLDFWPSDVVLYDSKEDAERVIEHLLQNDEFFTSAGDTRKDFTILTVATITVRGLALQFS